MNIYNHLIQQLVQAHITVPRLEAKMLLAHLLDKDISDATILEADLTPQQREELEIFIRRRIQSHEPLDKILGIKSFYKYDFMVNHNVLSPRPETEIIVEEALKLLGKKNARILDLGTGSGCILLSLLKELPQSEGVGVDASPEALTVAQKNAQKLDVENQVKWVNCSWFDKDFSQKFSKVFDLIVTNPPYIPDAEIETLDPEVKNYDPRMALSGGEDGYTSYRRIAEIVPLLLTDNGYILLECGHGQAKTVADIFIKQNLSLYKIIKDLQGIERCIILKK